VNPLTNRDIGFHLVILRVLRALTVLTGALHGISDGILCALARCRRLRAATVCKLDRIEHSETRTNYFLSIRIKDQKAKEQTSVVRRVVNGRESPLIFQITLLLFQRSVQQRRERAAPLHRQREPRRPIARGATPVGTLRPFVCLNVGAASGRHRPRPDLSDQTRPTLHLFHVGPVLLLLHAS
jgi:hypothetical protein